MEEKSNDLILEDIEDTEDDHLDKYQPSIFDQLPDEILIKILSYVSETDLAQKICLVSKRFYQLAMDASLWTDIRLPRDKTMEFQECSLLLSRSPMLQKLRMRERSDSNELAVLALEVCPMMRTLELIYCSKLKTDFFETLADRHSCLKELNLWGSGLEQHHLGEYAFSLSSLTRINLFDCRGVDDDGLVELATKCTRIQSINIKEITQVGDRGVEVLIDQQKEHLKSLELDGESLSAQAYLKLRLCLRLTVLDVSFAENMDGEALAAVLSLTELKVLTIKRGKMLTDSDFVLAFSTGKLNCLTSLDLSECSGIGDDGLISIAMSCSKLKRFDLNWCWELTDRGVGVVVERCPDLESLGLTGIVKLSSNPMVPMLKQLPNLVYLDLQQCPNINDDIMRDMVRAKPTLTVINYYGESFVFQSD
ncbi:hypothetical protein TCAL_10000 [Tigriopus californicus]|uniref:F-box domain-containing protein n=1 Tax=Tigriopus californicus TaxID=6832 RepID=A0A553PQ42_TIGCA|nr:F-box/LRR-repeat protein 2-like [Tigriopus californicus]TRY79808.1 hypothetical protein TCAL_10000 [Tigriopus californicus]|eukprot:TCALIF_10000-PA protein Name:"Similar to FBL4 F-box/LRR-repeat protein 4 (Arabidopsis thaliana)" AED:0.39 eAED:0.39 QI:0/-1/0/1/-1/1/1/0/421